MRTYDVTVNRDGRWWMVAIPELDGLTQTRRLAEAENMAAEYIAVTLDVPLSQVQVKVTSVDIGGLSANAAKELVEHLRAEAHRIEKTLADVVTNTAVALAGAEVPARDIASVLGVSFQRVSQIVNEATVPVAAAQARAIAAVTSAAGIRPVKQARTRPRAGIKQTTSKGIVTEPAKAFRRRKTASAASRRGRFVTKPAAAKAPGPRKASAAKKAAGVTRNPKSTPPPGRNATS